MTRARTALRSALVVGTVALLAAATMEAPAGASPLAAHGAACSSGAHSLSPHGARVYPEVGNGGYRSVAHRHVHRLRRRRPTGSCPGTTSSSPTAGDAVPDRLQPRLRAVRPPTTRPDRGLTVKSVTVNGQPATFKFVQPTYPGDPNGQDDPDPLAHQVSNRNPVSATQPEPAGVLAPGQRELPERPAVPRDQAGDHAVLADPERAPRSASPSTTRAGPGVHNDGDGTTEGWFRSNNPAGDGGVRHHRAGRHRWPGCRSTTTRRPSRRTTSTTRSTLGKTAIAPASWSPTRRRQPAGRELPRRLGDVALALARAHRQLPGENSIGSFDLPKQARDGIMYYEAQASSITAGAEGAATSRSWTSSRTSPSSRPCSTGRSRSPRTAS